MVPYVTAPLVCPVETWTGPDCGAKDFTKPWEGRPDHCHRRGCFHIRLWRCHAAWLHPSDRHTGPVARPEHLTLQPSNQALFSAVNGECPELQRDNRKTVV